MELGSAQPLPWFFPGPMGDPVCQGRHLRWFVRVKINSDKAIKCQGERQGREEREDDDAQGAGEQKNEKTDGTRRAA